jgi:putative transposase
MIAEGKKQGPSGVSTQRVQLKRAFKFRLYPHKLQEAELSEWELQLKKLYNLAHEQRKNSLARNRDWEFIKSHCPSCGVSSEKKPVLHTAVCDYVDYFRQAREMTALLEVDDQLARVVCSARQEILRDLDKAWQGWRKLGRGLPRFKKRTDCCRIYLSTTKHWAVNGRYLELSGAAESIGKIRIEQDRPWPEGAILTSCAIVRDVDEWYAVFPVTYTADIAQAPHRSVGINRGVVHAIADSYGRLLNSPQFYSQALDRIRKYSQDLSRKQPGSANARKARIKLARAHQKVRRQREIWLHEQSAHYVQNFDLVAIENLSVQSMVQHHSQDGTCIRGSCEEIVFRRGLCKAHYNSNRVKKVPAKDLARGILDVGWYEFGRQLEYKAAAHGCEIRKVDPGKFAAEAELRGDQIPAGISTQCSVCGKTLGKAASGRRWARCSECDMKELGDVNAAKNVLARAIAMTPAPKKTPKASIKIKGRKRSMAAANRAVEASGGDPPVRGPVEGGTLACMVDPSENAAMAAE